MATTILAIDIAKVENYIERELFPQYNFCQRSFLDGIFIDYRNNRVYFDNFYVSGHLSRNGSASEQARACQLDIQKRFGDSLEILIAMGAEERFFSPYYEHYFLIVRIGKKRLLVDPALKRVGEFSDTSHVIIDGWWYKIEELYQVGEYYASRHLELREEALIPLLFSGDTLVSFGFIPVLGIVGEIKSVNGLKREPISSSEFDSLFSGNVKLEMEIKRLRLIQKIIWE